MSKPAPGLKRRPDPAAANRLKELAALDDWTSQPATEAGLAVAQPAPAANQPQVIEPAAAISAPLQPSAPVRDKMPWEDAPVGLTPYTISLPSDLYLKMKWIATRRFGSTLRKNTIEMLEAAVAAQLKELGHEPGGQQH